MKIREQKRSNLRDKDLNYYMNLEYPITLEEFEEAGKKKYAFSIPDLPGCGAEGDTLEEARRRLEEAKEDWISVSLDEKLPIPEPVVEEGFSGKFLLRIPPGLHMKLTKIADKVGVSLNQLIRATLEKTVDNQLILDRLYLIETSLNELRIEVFNQRGQSEDETHLIPLCNKWVKPQSKWSIN